MAKKDDNRTSELLISSHMMMILSYTIFSVILIAEIFVMDWEKWAVFLIIGGVCASWYLHIRQVGQDMLRPWIIATLMMATFFFYGSHTTSTYDLAIVIAAYGLPDILDMAADILEVSKQVVLDEKSFELLQKKKRIKNAVQEIRVEGRAYRMLYNQVLL